MTIFLLYNYFKGDIMKKINNKGFTLIEILAVVAIIGILGIIAIPNVLDTINISKDTAYNILVDDIKVAGKQMFEEIKNMQEVEDFSLYTYDRSGVTTTEIIITKPAEENEESYITINLQTLVGNGYLTGINNNDKSPSNYNSKIILNPKTKEDIGECVITITKTITENNYKTSYKIESLTKKEKCPTTSDYQ